VEGEALDVARLVAERHQRAVERARGLLVAVATLPSLRRLDGPACSAELAELLEAAPLYANVAAVGPDGGMFCSAAPLAGPIHLGDRSHVRGALERGTFSVGGYMKSRSRGGLASFGFGQPVRDAEDDIVAVAVASFDLGQLQRDLDALPLPDDAEVVVVDQAGVVVTGRPAPGDRAGTRADDWLLAQMARGARVLEADAHDGARRIFAFQDVLGEQGAVAMRVAVAIPAAAAYAPVNRVLRNSALASLAFAILALAAALLGGELLVVRRLRAVIRASRRIAAGDDAARTGLAPGKDEIGDLARAFDEMAGSLERLSRQNRLLLDAVGEGVVGIDRAGRVIFANPAASRALGWSVAELRGADAHALFHGHRSDGTPLPQADCSIQAAMREGEARHGTDEVLVRRDGTTFPVEYVSTPLRDGDASVGVVLVFKDVSERRRLEERLRQVEKMEAIGQLAGGIAHDFNNLLTAIVSCAHVLREGLPADHELQPDVREIEHATARATALTRQLLAFGRRQRLAPRPVELRAVVRGMESMLRRLLPESVTLRVVTPAAGTVVADPAQLEMAVMNLAVNARDAMPSGGEIEIRVTEPAPGAAGDEGLPGGPLALLAVRDEGVGMDEATRDRIFEPFFTTKPAGKGTGLGLATVYGIVSQSGGVVRVRSQPGQGAEFRVYLPRHVGAETPASARAAARQPGVGTGTVLLVEDDAAIRAIARRTLARAGYRVLDAGTPGEALRIALGEEGDVDLLVSDVVLPGRSGWELSRELVAHRPGLRVLFMSGYAADPSGEPLLPEGAPLLAKPFTPEDLLGRVRAALDGAPAARAAGTARRERG
jgi:PAS domain S-box-containing protein